MIVLWSTLAGFALWLEMVYHFSGFGLAAMNPTLMLFLIVAWSGFWTLLIGLLKGKLKKTVYYLVLWLPTVWTGAQLVYLRIFRQPLLLDAIIQDGQDALSDYWREALDGIFQAIPFLFLLLLPAVLMPILSKKKGWKLPAFGVLQVMQTSVLILFGAIGSIVVLKVGEIVGLDYYEEYHEFYAPLTVAEYMGVLPVFQGDIEVRLRNLLENSQSEQASEPYVQAVAADIVTDKEPSPQLTARESVSGGNTRSARAAEFPTEDFPVEDTELPEEELPVEPVIVTTWIQDEDGNDLVPGEQKDAYLAAARQEVKDRYNFSACILQENYYADVLGAIISEN